MGLSQSSPDISMADAHASVRAPLTLNKTSLWSHKGAVAALMCGRTGRHGWHTESWDLPPRRAAAQS